MHWSHRVGGSTLLSHKGMVRSRKPTLREQLLPLDTVPSRHCLLAAAWAPLPPSSPLNSPQTGCGLLLGRQWELQALYSLKTEPASIPCSLLTITVSFLKGLCCLHSPHSSLKLEVPSDKLQMDTDAHSKHHEKVCISVSPKGKLQEGE